MGWKSLFVHPDDEEDTTTESSERAASVQEVTPVKTIA